MNESQFLIVLEGAVHWMTESKWEDAVNSEFQKMLAGGLYNANHSELVAKRKRAREITRIYNQTTEDEFEKRTELLNALLGKVGQNIYIEPPFYCDYGINIFAGDGLYLNFGCVVLDCAEVHFGENVLCGPYVQIYTVAHPFDPRARSEGLEFAKPIHIGDQVWIGGGSIILPGVTIGDNTVIGAGSVVTKDIPAKVLAAGNPCRVIRELK